MKKLTYSFLFLLLVSSCKIQSGSERTANDEAAVYKLHLSPAEGSSYHYAITNETETAIEVNEKNVETNNNSEVGINYTVEKDSAGNFLMQISYDKIHINTKAGDKETEMDASGAETSLDPMEKMLGVLKSAHLTAIITPAGMVKEVKGYKELGDQITGGFIGNDEHTKALAMQQWEQWAGNGLIKKGLDQLFTIFPDSAVHRGDKWKITSQGNNEFGLRTTAFYQLKTINDDLAIIESKAAMQSDSSTSTVSGFNAMTNLTGEQQGYFEMEAKTGMLLSCTIHSKIQGTVFVMGKEVPITVQTKMKMIGKRIK